MSYKYYLFGLLMVITCCLLYIAYLAWKKREFPVAVSLCIGMCTGAFYSFGYAFEIISSNLEQIQFWLRVEYIGISFGSFIWYIMVLQYTNHHNFLRKWNIILLAIIPLITFTSHYTNQWHHLYYRSMVINEIDGMTLVSLNPGPFYILHTLYSYMLIFIGMALLIQMYRKAALHMKKQIIFMMIGSCGPYVITLVYLSGILKSPFDISPFGFLFSGIFFMWGIYQFNMMKLIPHALKKVFDSMKDAVIVLDLDNSITSYNQSASQIFREELTDRKVIGQMATHIFSRYPELIETISLDSTLERRIKIINQTNLRYYQVHISDVLNKRQNRIGKMVLLSDITDIVLTEERLLTNSKQLSELNAFKDKMFTVVAHDIRDPLSILVNLMEILIDEMQLCGDKHDEIAYEMDKQIQNTFTLVESLLDWFRSQKGGMMFNPVTWNLSQAVKKNVGLLHTKSERKSIKIISEISSDTIVFTDIEMLDLILRNLLTNALKFTDKDGIILLKAEQVEEKVIVSISDTGKGIHPDQANQLLQEQKVCSRSGTAGERGIGLGLTLCKEFAQINGGELWFESTPNQGSTFYFSTPIPNQKYTH
jgi:PAS domain S-box-containing protein